jgi:hypothetical protein
VIGTQSVYRFRNTFEDQSSSDAYVDHYVIIGEMLTTWS